MFLVLSILKKKILILYKKDVRWLNILGIGLLWTPSEVALFIYLPKYNIYSLYKENNHLIPIINIHNLCQHRMDDLTGFNRFKDCIVFCLLWNAFNNLMSFSNTKHLKCLLDAFSMPPALTRWPYSLQDREPQVKQLYVRRKGLVQNRALTVKELHDSSHSRREGRSDWDGVGWEAPTQIYKDPP